MHLTLCTSIVLIHLSSIDSNSMGKKTKQDINFNTASHFMLLGETTVLQIQAYFSSQLVFTLRQKITSLNNTK